MILQTLFLISRSRQFGLPGKRVNKPALLLKINNSKTYEKLSRMSTLWITRFDVIEGKLDTATMLHVASPPGLSSIVDEDLQRRIERLETILVCKPPPEIEPTVAMVLNALVMHNSWKLSESNSAHEPDMKQTPEKQSVNSQQSKRSLAKCFTFDIYSEQEGSMGYFWGWMKW